MTAKRTQSAIKHPPYEDAGDDLSVEYPSSDGEPMAESKLQYVPLTDTVAALENHFIDRPDVFIAGDMLVYYRKNDNATWVAPDVFAVFGATGNHPRDSWIVWREGKAPDFVMEIASQSTWRRDVTEKRDIYASMGVTEYWRFDPTGEWFTPELAGERLTDGEYRPILLDGFDSAHPERQPKGGILRGHSAVLGLDICVLADLELHLYDPISRQWLLTPKESEAARLEEARARQAAETALRISEAGRQAAEDELRLVREQLRSLQSGQ